MHDADARLTAAIDTPDAAEIERQLDMRGWRITHILNTHHHADHAGGNPALKARYRCEIIGPRFDAARIPSKTRRFLEPDRRRNCRFVFARTRALKDSF